MKTYADIYDPPFKEGPCDDWVYDNNNNFVFQFEPKYNREGGYIDGWESFKHKVMKHINGEPQQFNGVFSHEKGNIFLGRSLLVHVMTIRGWGNLTGTHGLHHEEAANIQDSFAEWLVGALNN